MQQIGPPANKPVPQANKHRRNVPHLAFPKTSKEDALDDPLSVQGHLPPTQSRRKSAACQN